jgi:hypothetical protein
LLKAYRAEEVLVNLAAAILTFRPDKVFNNLTEKWVIKQTVDNDILLYELANKGINERPLLRVCSEPQRIVTCQGVRVVQVLRIQVTGMKPKGLTQNLKYYMVNHYPRLAPGTGYAFSMHIPRFLVWADGFNGEVISTTVPTIGAYRVVSNEHVMFPYCGKTRTKSELKAAK